MGQGQGEISVGGASWVQAGRLEEGISLSGAMQDRLCADELLLGFCMPSWSPPPICRLGVFRAGFLEEMTSERSVVGD